MPGLGELAVYLTAKTEGFDKGIDSAIRKLTRMASLTPASMAVAGGAVVAFATKSLVAFAESEKVLNKFNATLRANNESVLRYSPSLQKLAGDLQNVTTFDDEAILSAMSLGLNMGISADKMKAATEAAVGLTSRGMGLEEAMSLIGKAANGNFAALGRMGIKLEDGMTDQEKFNKLLEIGASKMAIVTGEADSLSGRWTQMMNSIGNLWEAFGSFFNELIDFKGIIADITGKVAEFGEYVQAHAFEWAFMLKSVWIEFKFAFLQVWNLISPFFNYIADSVSSFVDIVLAAGNNIGEIFSWIYENAGKVWNGMFDIVKAWVSDVVNIYKGLGEQIWNTLTFKDTDWTGVFANVGKNLEKTMKDLKISNLELDTSGVDSLVKTYKNLADNIMDVPNQIEKTEEERIKAQEDLFNRERDRKLAEIDKTYKQSKDDLTKKETSAEGVDLRKEKIQLSAAMEKGSVEAYSAIAKSGGKVQEQIAKNTKDTAEGIAKMTRAVELLGTGGEEFAIP